MLWQSMALREAMDGCDETACAVKPGSQGVKLVCRRMSWANTRLLGLLVLFVLVAACVGNSSSPVVELDNANYREVLSTSSPEDVWIVHVTSEQVGAGHALLVRSSSRTLHFVAADLCNQPRSLVKCHGRARREARRTLQTCDDRLRRPDRGSADTVGRLAVGRIVYILIRFREYGQF